MRRSATYFFWVLVLALLVGCSSTIDPAYSVFGVEQATADKIPPGDSAAIADLDPGSTRLLGEFSGYTFYAAYAPGRPETTPFGPMLCLIAVLEGSPDHAASSCSAGVSAELGMGVPGAELMLVPDTFNASALIEDGWTRVHQNLLAL
ncbi:hypothetical protein [Arthrobacter sp. CAN_A1]|uniref:hypothetical protein n=1 Tax=Arthrobacter sp. CAN_A1 TaxID=2787717 RepID=UPI0018C9BB6C